MKQARAHIDRGFRPKLSLLNSPNAYTYNEDIESLGFSDQALPAHTLHARHRAAVWVGKKLNIVNEYPVLAVLTESEMSASSQQACWYIGVMPASTMQQSVVNKKLIPSIALEAATYAIYPDINESASAALALRRLVVIHRG